jgi:copper chaperone
MCAGLLHGDTMQKYKVPDMSCAHCVRSIEKAIKSVDPTAAVACDLTSKFVEVKTSASLDRISAALVEAGYKHERLADAR